ncbi:MAG: hypothetical protein ACQSGP_10160 [Frankia sp.]
MKTRKVADPRRWAAFRCFGIYGQIMEVQAFVEDLEGALDAGQLPVVKFAGLQVIRNCLSLRCVLAEGFPPDPGDAMANVFAGLPDAVNSAGVTLSTRLAAAVDMAAARPVAADIFGYVREFERDLGFATKVPSVRRAEGLFPALRLAREILPVNRSAHLPLALPSEWVPQSTPGLEPPAPRESHDHAAFGPETPESGPPAARENHDRAAFGPETPESGPPAARENHDRAAFGQGAGQKAGS